MSQGYCWQINILTSDVFFIYIISNIEIHLQANPRILRDTEIVDRHSLFHLIQNCIPTLHCRLSLRMQIEGNRIDEPWPIHVSDFQTKKAVWWPISTKYVITHQTIQWLKIKQPSLWSTVEKLVYVHFPILATTFIWCCNKCWIYQKRDSGNKTGIKN